MIRVNYDGNCSWALTSGRTRNGYLTVIQFPTLAARFVGASLAYAFCGVSMAASIAHLMLHILTVSISVSELRFFGSKNLTKFECQENPFQEMSSLEIAGRAAINIPRTPNTPDDKIKWCRS